MSTLPWLEEPLSRVLDVFAQGRLPHALLIRAQKGWGETEFGDRLALSLLERDDLASARSLAHPDLKWIAPEGSVIKVDEIRALAAFAVGTRQSARCKVAVIESAELMNPNAANALLKTLEEPPKDTYLLLTTSRAGRLLPTIVSRCQGVSIGRDEALARQWLLSQWPADAIEEKLFECGDAPLAVHEALTAEEPRLAPLLEGLISDGKPISTQVGELLPWDVDRLTSGWYRHCVAMLGGDSRLAGVAGMEPARIAEFVDELGDVRRQLLTTNSANQRLLYERLASLWQRAVGPV